MWTREASMTCGTTPMHAEMASRTWSVMLETVPSRNPPVACAESLAKAARSSCTSAGKIHTRPARESLRPFLE
eukprot:8512662-Heterocapsa_arctica.AAC.1